MKRVTVFCGSSFGSEPVFEEQAILTGLELAKAGIELVYGGARVGLMGAVADGAIKGGGKVTGVLPRFMQGKELAHNGITQLLLVETMHERKMKMNELCDGIIALPGGFGTMEELFEMLTWAQLGLHKKPIGLLNTAGFYDPLIGFIAQMVNKGFLKELNQKMLLVSDNIGDLLKQMNSYEPPLVTKWLSKDET